MGPGRTLLEPAHIRRNSRLSPTCYLDSSALFKLAVDEEESHAAWLFLQGANWISSELVLTELPRAIRAKAEINPRLDLDLSLGRSEIILQRVEMHPIDRLTLWRAGRIFEPHLRSFDAVHVVTALNVRPIDAFVTYDMRQAEAALVEGLNVRSPGA